MGLEVTACEGTNMFSDRPTPRMVETSWDRQLVEFTVEKVKGIAIPVAVTASLGAA